MSIDRTNYIRINKHTFYDDKAFISQRVLVIENNGIQDNFLNKN